MAKGVDREIHARQDVLDRREITGEKEAPWPSAAVATVTVPQAHETINAAKATASVLQAHERMNVPARFHVVRDTVTADAINALSRLFLCLDIITLPHV